MRVLVSDSSVLLELAKRGLLPAMFRLPFEFVVPDLLYQEELIDLGEYSRDDLRILGLRVEELDPVGVTTALSYQARRRRLSLVDCFALALASRRGYRLLTGDKVMRSFAEAEAITVHGVLWLVDEMVAATVLPIATILAALTAMRDDPRCHLPAQELATRIGVLSRG